MRRLSLAVEELMGATPAAPAGQAPGMMGPSKPKIALKGQPGAGGAPAGNMPADPKAAGAQLAAALAQAGGAIQNTVDAGVNQANLRQGNPDASVQNGQPQPARTTPQQRMQQQRDELALKKGNLPKDLTDDVANIAQQQKPGMPQKPGIPNQRQPGGAPMESVNEARNDLRRFKNVAHQFADETGHDHVVVDYSDKAEPNQTPLKVMGHDAAEKAGHKILYRAKPKSKGSVTEAEGTFKKTHEFVSKDGKHAFRAGRNTSAGTWDHRHYSKTDGGAWKHHAEHGYDGHESKDDAAAAAKADRDSYDSGKTFESITEGKMPKQFMKPDGKMSNPDDVSGYDKVTDAQAKATAKHKAAIKGDAKLGGSTLSKDSGRGSQWQAVRAGKLKSTVKEEERETTVLGDEGRKAILDEFFA